ncbi:hypothetical protein AGMMS49938_12310 [Fibrobacterales bacterium]|nr:hypothetical protein AGMMS49938_12310 [Fibrobacterales bacterium]
MRFNTLFLSLSAFAVTAFAADVSFEGSLDADYGNYLEKDFKVNNAANHDLRLKMNVDLDENVRAVVGAASKSIFVNSNGSEEYSRLRHRDAATPMGSDRWTAFEFDGISLEWTVWRDLTFVFGDLSYSFGAFDYYYWRNSDYYAGVLTSQGLRGLGVNFGKDGYVYVGASDANDKSGRIAASYAFAMPGLNQVNHKLTLAPMLDIIKGGGRAHRYTFGVDANYSRSFTDLNYALRGIWGIHPSHGDLVNTFAVEPSLNYKKFSVAGLGYFAFLASDAGDDLVIADTYAPDETMVYVEPSYALAKKFSLGLAGEWHKPGEDKDDWFLIAPTGYLYPTAGVDLSFWLGYAITEGHNNPSFGISSSVKF